VYARMKKVKISIKKKKKRIPIPQKPPKVEDNPKTYKRVKEKLAAKKKIREETSAQN